MGMVMFVFDGWVMTMRENRQNRAVRIQISRHKQILYKRMVDGQLLTYEIDAA